MIRLFVALALPEDVRRRLEMLRGGIPGARWQSAEQMHLTLRFIGEVDGAAFREIMDALADIEAEAFTLSLEGVGHFPPRGRARILWAGVAPCPALLRLQERTEAVITGLGHAPDGRNYAPHVTLARFASRVPQHRLQEFMSYHGPVRQRAVSGALVRAVLEPPGGRWRALRSGGTLPAGDAAARRMMTSRHAPPHPVASIRSMSSSERPKWWPISWISTWRTTSSRLLPVSTQ